MTGNFAKAGPDEENPNVDRWPDPKKGQVEVLLLGTVHLAHSDFNDIFDQTKQHEFQELADRLGTWNPDGVAVERPSDQHETLEATYTGYHSGDRTYSSESGTENAPSTNEISLKDTEVVQIGFRLADRQNHDCVYPVDYPMTMDAHLDEELEMEEFNEMKEAAFSRLDVPISETPRSEVINRWQHSAVSEFLEWYNREENLVTNEQNHFAVALAGADHPYVGSRLLTGWYERNLRIVENVWQVASRENLERLVLVMGQGHSHILRHLLANAPPFCPVNSWPLLTD